MKAGDHLRERPRIVDIQYSTYITEGGQVQERKERKYRYSTSTY